MSKLRGSTKADSASSAELETERRRRIRVESELELYRRQSKQSENSTTANAKRVAITLACRCAELSDELARLKGVKEPRTHISEDVMKAIIFQEPKPDSNPVARPPEVRSGWDVDDDDLFSLLN